MIHPLLTLLNQLDECEYTFARTVPVIGDGNCAYRAILQSMLLEGVSFANEQQKDNIIRYLRKIYNKHKEEVLRIHQEQNVQDNRDITDTEFERDLLRAFRHAVPTRNEQKCCDFYQQYFPHQFNLEANCFDLPEKDRILKFLAFCLRLELNKNVVPLAYQDQNEAEEHVFSSIMYKEVNLYFNREGFDLQLYNQNSNQMAREIFDLDVKNPNDLALYVSFSENVPGNGHYSVKFIDRNYDLLIDKIINDNREAADLSLDGVLDKAILLIEEDESFVRPYNAERLQQQINRDLEEQFSREQQDLIIAQQLYENEERQYQLDLAARLEQEEKDRKRAQDFQLWLDQEDREERLARERYNRLIAEYDARIAANLNAQEQQNLYNDNLARVLQADEDAELAWQLNAQNQGMFYARNGYNAQQDKIYAQQLAALEQQEAILKERQEGQDAQLAQQLAALEQQEVILKERQEGQDAQLAQQLADLEQQEDTDEGLGIRLQFS